MFFLYPSSEFCSGFPCSALRKIFRLKTKKVEKRRDGYSHTSLSSKLRLYIFPLIGNSTLEHSTHVLEHYSIAGAWTEENLGELLSQGNYNMSCDWGRTRKCWIVSLMRYPLCHAAAVRKLIRSGMYIGGKISQLLKRTTSSSKAPGSIHTQEFLVSPVSVQHDRLRHNSWSPCFVSEQQREETQRCSHYL